MATKFIMGYPVDVNDDPEDESLIHKVKQFKPTNMGHTFTKPPTRLNIVEAAGLPKSKNFSRRRGDILTQYESRRRKNKAIEEFESQYIGDQDLYGNDTVQWR
jgi:hypothetical protein